jgi:hypothetical protein
MCFELSHNSKAKIARKDIVCYKEVENVGSPFEIVIRSFFAEYPYELGKLNKPVKIRIQKCIDEDKEIIHKGYHSYEFIPKCLIFPNDVIVKCIIPKGTKYYSNLDGEYVSENIIIKEILK